MHDKLVINVNAIDTKIPSTSTLVNKTQNDAGKKDLYKKIKDFDQKIFYTRRLFKKTDFRKKTEKSFAATGAFLGFLEGRGPNLRKGVNQHKKKKNRI